MDDIVLWVDYSEKGNASIIETSCYFVKEVGLCFNNKKTKNITHLVIRREIKLDKAIREKVREYKYLDIR